jgi:hypothetical protein
MANQFTKGTRTKHDESTKDKIRAELLAKRLFNFAKAKGEKRQKYAMDSTQVAAAKVLIDKGKPSLSSVEQHHVDEMESEEQMLAMLQGIAADPGLKARILAALGGPIQPANDAGNDVQSQQSAAPIAINDR